MFEHLPKKSSIFEPPARKLTLGEVLANEEKKDKETKLQNTTHEERSETKPIKKTSSLGKRGRKSGK